MFYWGSPKVVKVPNWEGLASLAWHHKVFPGLELLKYIKAIPHCPLIP